MILLSHVPSSKHVQISLFSFCCIIFSCHLPNIDLTFVNIYFFWHNVILSTVTRISNAICNWATVSLKFKFFWSSRFYFTVIIYIISNLWYGKNREGNNFSYCEKSLAVQLLFVFSRYFTFSIITQLGIFALKSLLKNSVLNVPTILNNVVNWPSYFSSSCGTFLDTKVYLGNTVAPQKHP